MSRYKFFEIFRENPDGTLSSKKSISVNGVIFGVNAKFGQGVNFGGINFHNYKNLDIAAEEQDNLLVIKGFYK